jgi:hypothetical protein
MIYPELAKDGRGKRSAPRAAGTFAKSCGLLLFLNLA